MTAALDVRDLRLTFNAGTPAALPALQDVSLSVARGRFVAILGFNGSGKSTLLNAIAGSVTPDGGRIRIGDRDVTRWPEHRRAQLVGHVFQNPALSTAPTLTVAKNLTLASRRARAWPGLGWAVPASLKAELRERVHRLRMGLEDRMDARMGSLSGGERQALTLLMATLVSPKLLLLDEHTAALDPKSAEQVLRLTQEFVAQGGYTTLMVTHSLQQAVRLGERILMLQRGRIVRDFANTDGRRVRVEELLFAFNELRNEEQLDESAAGMLRRGYV